MYKHFLLLCGVEHSTKKIMSLKKRCKLTANKCLIEILKPREKLEFKKQSFKLILGELMHLFNPNRKMLLPYGKLYYYCNPSYLCDTMHERIFNDKHSNFQ